MQHKRPTNPNTPSASHHKRLKTNPHSLDPKQQEILDLCLTGRNVFLTGVGGTGKTFVLRLITEAMRNKYGQQRVAVTASTGVAAVQAEGQTLHSITGAGVPNVVSDFDRCRKLQSEWRLMGCLIIDEVSLIEPAYLDWLDATIRDIRGVRSRAFGGIQLICCGDFLQLPGICKGVSLASKCPAAASDNPRPKQIPVHVDQFQSYVFQTVCWRDARFAIAELTTIFRQSEARMISALHKIRRGVVDEEVEAFVTSCSKELPEDDEIKPTILYARNKDVDSENQASLDALPSELVTFDARDSVQPDDIGAPAWVCKKLEQDAFFRNGPIPERVVLKVGAQVLLTKNLDRVLVNGSRGVVKHFMPKERCKEELVQRIALCGSHEDRTALISQLEAVKRAAQSTAYPVVLFDNGQQVLCTHTEFTHRVWNMGECKRSQVPLRLAWSLTIHRCQGSSLDRVQVDLSGCFSPGQCYVALSRARTSAGLRIVGFSRDAVRADPLAVAFHDALSAGTLDSFQAPLWFEPVLAPGIDPNWRKLFESSAVFRAWEERV